MLIPVDAFLFVSVIRFVAAPVTQPRPKIHREVTIHRCDSHMVPLLFDKASGSFENQLSPDGLWNLKHSDMSSYKSVRRDLKQLFKCAHKSNKLHNNLPKLHLPKSRLKLVHSMIAKVSMMRYGNGVTHGLLAGMRGVGKTSLLLHLSLVLTSLFDDLVVFYFNCNANLVLISEALDAWAKQQNIEQRGLCEVLKVLSKRVVFFVDEVQDLFLQADKPEKDDFKKDDFIQELKILTNSQNVSLFCCGSAHIVETMRQHGSEFHAAKLPTFRIMPLRNIKEFKKALKSAHPSWLKNNETADLELENNETADLDLELVTSIFNLTGGVYRTLVNTKADAVAEMQKFTDAPSFDWTVLPIIYKAQTSVFDPFNQSSVASQYLLFELNADEDLTTLHQLADAGVLFLDEQNRGSFLLPAHYFLMKEVVLDLTFIERTAIHFPQGRFLAEQFELFYAEKLCRDSMNGPILRLSPSNELEHYNIKTTGRNFHWVESHAGQVFKLSSDMIGFDLMYWSISKPATSSNQSGQPPRKKAKLSPIVVTLFLIQIKVGAARYYVTRKEVQHLLAEYPDGTTYKKFVATFQNQLPNGAVLNVEPMLVTSRIVKGAVEAKLARRNIAVLAGQTNAACWGPRVQAYCDQRRKFTLFGAIDRSPLARMST